jgi:putative redox protein
MKAAINWEGGLKFTGSGPSGLPVRLDGETTSNGEPAGFRPMEMIALGLIGCQAMDVLSVLQKKRQDVTRFEVRFDGPRSPEYPKVFTSANITLVLTGRGVDQAAVLRSIELAATKYCPAQAMLEKSFPIDLHYEIYEDEGNGDRRLVSQGVWQNRVME